MNRHDDERLAGWVDDEFDESGRVAFLQELRDDPNLRAAADDYRRMVFAVRDALQVDDDPPAQTEARVARILEVVAGDAGRETGPRGSNRRWLAVFAMAAGLLLTGSLLFGAFGLGDAPSATPLANADRAPATEGSAKSLRGGDDSVVRGKSGGRDETDAATIEQQRESIGQTASQRGWRPTPSAPPSQTLTAPEQAPAQGVDDRREAAIQQQVRRLEERLRSAAATRVPASDVDTRQRLQVGEPQTEAGGVPSASDRGDDRSIPTGIAVLVVELPAGSAGWLADSVPSTRGGGSGGTPLDAWLGQLTSAAAGNVIPPRVVEVVAAELAPVDPTGDSDATRRALGNEVSKPAGDAVAPAYRFQVGDRAFRTEGDDAWLDAVVLGLDSGLAQAGGRISVAVLQPVPPPDPMGATFQSAVPLEKGTGDPVSPGGPVGVGPWDARRTLEQLRADTDRVLLDAVDPRAQPLWLIVRIR